MITVSAPGKLILFGEHAVVYGYPCIVTSISKRLMVAVRETADGVIRIEAPQAKNTFFCEKAIESVCRELGIHHHGLQILTSCAFSCQYGFGSSSAVTVSMVYAIAQLFGKKIDTRRVFDVAYKSVLSAQKISSGADVAAASYGGTLYYTQNGKIIEPLFIKETPFVVAYSGTKADTVSLINNVKVKREKEPEKVNRIFTAISELVEKAKADMLRGDWETVGKWMNFNQEYLRDLGVSTEKLEAMIEASKIAGAWGAKLSGAGGGDCMIALTSPDKRSAVIDAITKVGGQVVDATIHAEGVRLEKFSVVSSQPSDF